METQKERPGRRQFVRDLSAGLFASYAASLVRPLAAETQVSDLFWIKRIPNNPFSGSGGVNYHIGLEKLLQLMGKNGLKFYRSSKLAALSGPDGLISRDDVVLLKVNAQWKYRGCTNSDLIRGLVQRIHNHPDGYRGEVVIIENGQGRGSLKCDTASAYSDHSVHANANNESHSFHYLINEVFKNSRVSGYLLDPIRGVFIGEGDHVRDGYRIYEDVSYPCFTTAGGRRVELKKGIWTGSRFSQNLKLINIPVLKHHDVGGSEITASLKHFYGVLSMEDGNKSARHYSALGATCGKMVVSVMPPVLNIIDAIWVSHSSLKGYPATTTTRANQLLASQDPVALDYWAAKYILYPIDSNPRHHPSFSGINSWLWKARDLINARGGLRNPEKGIVVSYVTKSESNMRVFSAGF